MINVLFVDDERHLPELAKKFLERESEEIKVETSIHPEKALENIKQRDFDCVVTDYQMPGINGIELLKRVRNEFRLDLPFIIFTARGREEVAMEALNNGADRYVKKGGDPQSQFCVLAEAIKREVKHHRREKSVIENEERYRRLFENAKVGMLLLKTSNGKIQDVNPYLLDLLHYKKEELLGNEIWNIRSFKDIIKSKQEFKELKENAHINYEDLTIETKNGGKIFVELDITKYKARGEEIIQCDFRDITKRKQKEKELKESQERLKKAIEEVPFPIMLHADDGEVIKINEVWTKLTGYKKEEIPTISEWAEKAYGNKKNQIIEIIEDIYGRERNTSEGEFKISTKNDETRIWEFKSANIGKLSDGRNLVISLATDITDRKRTEEKLLDSKKKLRELHNVVSELEGLKSENDVCQVAIEAAEEILDFSVSSIDLVDDSGRLVVEESSSEISPEDYREGKPEEVGLAGKTFLENESYVLPDLQEDEEAEPVKDEYRSAISVPINNRGVFQAISTKPNNFDERDLEFAELLMDHVSEALRRIQTEKKEKFLHSLLRHDVRNKAQVTQGYLDLLGEYDLPEEVESYVSKASKATKEGINVIEKVRTLRYIEREEEIREINIESVLKKGVKEIESQATKKGIDIKLHINECKVLGGSLLKELFYNLFENSIIHSEGTEINVSLKETQNRCIVIIEDDGKGIPDEQKTKIFERGFKGGESSGSGLGMYLAKQIAENYRGDIEVKDSDLGGSKFEIHLRKP